MRYEMEAYAMAAASMDSSFTTIRLYSRLRISTLSALILVTIPGSDCPLIQRVTPFFSFILASRICWNILGLSFALAVPAQAAAAATSNVRCVRLVMLRPSDIVQDGAG